MDEVPRGFYRHARPRLEELTAFKRLWWLPVPCLILTLGPVVPLLLLAQDLSEGSGWVALGLSLTGVALTVWLRHSTRCPRCSSPCLRRRKLLEPSPFRCPHCEIRLYWSAQELARVDDDTPKEGDAGVKGTERGPTTRAGTV